MRHSERIGVNSFLPKSAMYWYNKILRKLVPRVLPAPSPKERALIDTLRAQIRALPEILPDEGVNRAEQFWMENRVNLRRELLSKDPRAFCANCGPWWFANTAPTPGRRSARLRRGCSNFWANAIIPSACSTWNGAWSGRRMTPSGIRPMRT